MKPFDLTWKQTTWSKPKHLILWVAMVGMSYGAMDPTRAQTAAQATSQTPLQSPTAINPVHVQAHASLCLSCHSESSLRALSKEAFLDKMRAFQVSPIKDQVMHQMAKGLKQEQVLELAQFFSFSKRVEP
jgi:cytochrome c553